MRNFLKPTFQRAAPDPVPDPVVDGAKSGSHVGMAVIILPPFGELVEAGDHLLDAQPATAAGEFAYPFFEALDGF